MFDALYCSTLYGVQVRFKQNKIIEMALSSCATLLILNLHKNHTTEPVAMNGGEQPLLIKRERYNEEQIHTAIHCGRFFAMKGSLSNDQGKNKTIF